MKERKLCSNEEIKVFENELGSICIRSDDEWVYFDECYAEKICKFIMEVAQEIRGARDE